MDSTIKNITIIMLILSFAFLGYYLYAQKDAINLSGEAGVGQDLFAKVQKYIERRNILDQVSLDTTILKDQRFISAVSYSSEVVEQKVKRENPFDKPLKSINNEIDNSN